MNENTRGYGRTPQAPPRTQQTRARQQTQQQEIPTAGAGKQAPVVHKQKLFEKFGTKFGVDQDVLIETLKATAFKTKAGDPLVTNEQLIALLIVADQYGLNPFTKEIYAYPDKQNGIVPVVSVDGWIRIINEHPQYDGADLAQSDVLVSHPSNEHRPCFDSMTVTIYRKDRDRPTVVTEYFDEVYRAPFTGRRQDGSTYAMSGPWQTHPKRLLRHKTLIQGGRVAFGFAGIYDEDEATRIVESDSHSIVAVQSASRVSAAADALRARQGGSQPATATPTQPTQSPASPQGNVSRATPQETSELPWDKTVKSKEEWIKLFRAAKNVDEVTKLWSDCVDEHDSERKEMPVELDAEMQLKREFFENQG